MKQIIITLLVLLIFYFMLEYATSCEDCTWIWKYKEEIDE